MRKKTFTIILGFICILGFALRTYKLNNPIGDWHSWRQVDTAAVARNFIKFGVDPLHPRYDDLSNIQSGKDNPQGWRMVEFPIYQLVSYSVFKIIPGITIEESLRLVSISASVLSIALVGLIAKKLSSSVVGLGSALVLAILPYSVYYGRTILPEPFMVSMSMISLYLALVSQDLRGQKKFLLLFASALGASLALLVKPFAVFMLLPLPFLFISSLGITWMGMVISGISACIAVIPLLLWRQWITHYPEGIPVYTWLLNEGNIRLKGAWFHWLFAERVGKLILGYWGVVVLVLGILKKKEHREGLFYSLFLLGGLAYFVIVARGNVQHDYYQIPIIPIIAFYMGLGGDWFIHPPKEWGKVSSRIVGIVILGFMLAFSWFEIRGFYWINHPEIVEAGKEADRILPPDAKVIAPYNGDTTFLYQTNRQGWPIGFEIEKKIEQGAQYYVTVSPTDADGETKDLASRYVVLERNERFAIIDLTRKNE